jgi:hypothetical protein
MFFVQNTTEERRRKLQGEKRKLLCYKKLQDYHKKSQEAAGNIDIR